MNMSLFIYLILSPAENVICPLLSALYVPLAQSSSLFTGHEKNCSLDMASWPHGLSLPAKSPRPFICLENSSSYLRTQT